MSRGVFEDVAREAYYNDYINWAVEHKLSSGVDATHKENNIFDPSGTTTRAEVTSYDAESVSGTVGKPALTAGRDR